MSTVTVTLSPPVITCKPQLHEKATNSVLILIHDRVHTSTKPIHDCVCWRDHMRTQAAELVTPTPDVSVYTWIAAITHVAERYLDVYWHDVEDFFTPRREFFFSDFTKLDSSKYVREHARLCSDLFRMPTPTDLRCMHVDNCQNGVYTSRDMEELIPVVYKPVKRTDDGACPICLFDELEPDEDQLPPCKRHKHE